MFTFALRKIDAVVGIQRFDKLTIDGFCPFDEFEATFKNQFSSEIASIYHHMNDVANLKALPYTKFHFYDDGKDGVREFEFKSKHLRVYGITQLGGKIIILGGSKANQKKEQNEFRRLKRLYLDFKRKDQHL